MVYFTVFLQPNIRNNIDRIQIRTFKVQSSQYFPSYYIINSRLEAFARTKIAQNKEKTWLF